MSSEAPAKTTINIGDVNLGTGATAILGMNNICSDSKAQEKIIKKCKDALSISEPSSVRDELLNIKGNLTEGTCQWIRRNESYQSWLSAQDPSLLWISGGPGRGKTMLSIFLTQEWKTRPESVLYVFYGDKSTNDEVAILRSLLYQVLNLSPTMVSHVEDRFGSEERTKRTLSSRGDLWAMFASMLKDPNLGSVLGLIDGLDECPRDSTRWLLNNLRHVFDKGSKSQLLPPNPFKLVIVSRDMPGLRSYPRLNLETKTGVIAEDVSRVIDAKMKEHNLFLELDDEFITEVKTTLRHRSDGPFLWAGFAIQELLSVETKTEMRLALNAIPRELGALYSNILLRIKGPMKEKIAQLLRWVTLARHHLTASQLAGALDVDAQTILDLVAMSGSLLTLGKPQIWSSRSPEPSPEFFDDRTDFLVKLVHQSVSDFLKGDATEDILPPPEFRIHVGEMELQITQRCLRELDALFSRFTVQRADIVAKTFSSYATWSWPEHARRCDERLERLLDSDIAFVQSERGSIIRSRWWNCYRMSSHLFPETTGFSLLHVCSTLGLLPLAKRLLQDMASTGSQVDDPDSRGWTALCYALDNGHTTVAQLLVDHGASLTRDVGERKENFKPIHQAMDLGAEVAAPFLKKTLESISPNPLAPWPSSRDTALEHSLFRKAAALGDERFIRILCANGAAHDSGIARLALEDALRNGWSVAVTELLLQHGASTRNLNPTLVLKGGPGTVETLLDHGMDPNSSPGRDPMLHLAVRVRPDLVEVLLDYGAHINALDNDGRTALIIALTHHNIKSAAMLLKRGADPTAKDKNGNTAFHGIVKHGMREGVEFLLRHGLDANIRNDDGQTALASVLKHWAFPIPEVLLKHGAYAIFRGEGRAGGSNPPLEAGSHVETKDICIEPALLLDAVWGRSVHVVQLLLRCGADVNALAHAPISIIPLRAAIMCRHVDMVRVLLEYGADPNTGLVQLGAPLDLNRQFHDGQTARIAELLCQRGGVCGERRKRPGTRLRHAFTSS